ncbi:MAG: DUF1570 domain-containing protein [Pirellulaceae bacterium]|jgi:hypothetical protein|nr:DUF1570 domain-containing protein [Pirellulaceae bacterium]
MDLDRRLVWQSAVVTLMVAVSVPVSAQVARWPDELQAGQFLCHADFPLAAYQPLLSGIPALEEDLTRLLGLQPSREWIHVFLFHNKSTYQGYVKQYFPEAPSRKALFIKDRGLGMVFAYEGDQFEVDLRHECTHALLNAALPVTPLWLDEGLAEYFEVEAGQRAAGHPHQKYVKWNAYLGQTPRLEDLEQVREVNQMTRTRYRQAWAWVHFMLHGPPEAREELQRFLADLQALTPPGLLSRRLRHRLPDLDARFADHCRNWQP